MEEIKMEDNIMIGCRGKTYASKKVDLLHQFGYHDVTRRMFKGMNEIQIDNKARQILSMSPSEFSKSVRNS